MPHITRQKVTIPVPKKATITTRGGTRYATWTGRDGDKKQGKLSADGNRCTIVMKEWYYEYRDVNGDVQRYKLSADIRESRRLAAEFQAKLDAGDTVQVGDIETLLRDYYDHLLAKGCRLKQAKLVTNRIRKIANELGFRILGDCNAHKVEKWLANQRKREGIPFSYQTSNAYVKALRSFANYLIKKRKILATNPFDDVPLLNADNHRTYERVPFSVAELWQLIDYVRDCGRSLRLLPALDRAMLYLTAAYTGFRLNELGHLTPDCFRDVGDTRVVVLKGKHNKNGRDAVQPLPSKVADMLFDFVTTKKPNERIWPRTGFFVAHSSEVIEKDIKRAGLPRLPQGQVRDFHTLRTTYITMLALSGVSMQHAQRLARLSSSSIMMKHYTRLGLTDLQNEVNRIDIG